MIFSYLLNMQSHPSWVCGLKQTGRPLGYYLCRSHPSWVCGLKQKGNCKGIGRRESHPSWVCGLKQQDSVHQQVMVSHTLRGCVD